MGRVAIVADSASDLSPERARAAGITVVPLLVDFAERQFRAGVDLSTEAFWDELTAPGAPFPKTAAAGPGVFQETFERLFAEGSAEAIVAVHVGSKLSATYESARLGAEAIPDREIHVVDTETASMATGLLAILAAELAAAGQPAASIAATVERRIEDAKLYVVLETLEYLRRGGRISGAQAAVGNLLSVKPIITIQDGVVETADRVRTRGKARHRLLELLTAMPLERIEILHGRAEGIETFADELAQRSGIPRDRVGINLIGPSVGPHVGPGAYGAVTLRRAA